jgi:Fic family protein
MKFPLAILVKPMTQKNKKIITQYDHPDQFLPLLPAEHVSGPLYEKASQLIKQATHLNALPTSGKRALRPLLRKMNSYYTNKMEGQHTRPSEIDQALAQKFSQNAEIARKQRLALAHIEAEVLCEQWVEQQGRQGQDPVAYLYQPETLRQIHAHLFNHASEEDLKQSDGTFLKPGFFRTRKVQIGRHEAPAPESVNAFLTAWQDAYTKVRKGEASVVAAAAAHHRLTWVHPFLDGNGRTSRLHTHLLFDAMDLSAGLWSPLRGFARTEAQYKSLLQAADEHRRGDLDGRGNLTQEGLVNWIEYVLDISLDQVQFMTQNLKQEGMFNRIAASLTFEAASQNNGIRIEALRPLQFLYAVQSDMTRSEFKQLCGLGERVATSLLSALLKKGYLETDSPHGNVRFAVPQHALRFYFPALWPEAEQDQSLSAG